MAWWWFPIGIVIGACFGLVVSGLLSQSDTDDDFHPVKKWWEGDSNE